MNARFFLLYPPQWWNNKNQTCFLLEKYFIYIFFHLNLDGLLIKQSLSFGFVYLLDISRGIVFKGEHPIAFHDRFLQLYIPGLC